MSPLRARPSACPSTPDDKGISSTTGLTPILEWTKLSGSPTGGSPPESKKRSYIDEDLSSSFSPRRGVFAQSLERVDEIRRSRLGERKQSSTDSESACSDPSPRGGPVTRSQTFKSQKGKASPKGNGEKAASTSGDSASICSDVTSSSRRGPFTRSQAAKKSKLNYEGGRAKDEVGTFRSSDYGYVLRDRTASVPGVLIDTHQRKHTVGWPYGVTSGRKPSVFPLCMGVEETAYLANCIVRNTPLFYTFGRPGEVPGKITHDVLDIVPKGNILTTLTGEKVIKLGVQSGFIAPGFWEMHFHPERK